MPTRPIAFYFDFVDPASYLTSQVARQVGAAAAVERHGFELCVPPRPLLDPADRAWADRQSRAVRYARAIGVPMSAPAFVPWTRKAHELAEFARSKGHREALVQALFRAHFVGGNDIGRIDVLADVAAEAGLDGAEARTALGVDRYAGAVAEARAAARERGVQRVPVLAFRGRQLAGLRSPGEIRRWLEAAVARAARTPHPEA